MDTSSLTHTHIACPFIFISHVFRSLLGVSLIQVPITALYSEVHVHRGDMGTQVFTALFFLRCFTGQLKWGISLHFQLPKVISLNGFLKLAGAENWRQRPNEAGWKRTSFVYSDRFRVVFYWRQHSAAIWRSLKVAQESIKGRLPCQPQQLVLNVWAARDCAEIFPK